MNPMTTPDNNQPEFNPEVPQDVPDFSEPTVAEQTPQTPAPHATKVETSIAGSTWVALILGIVLLILLLVFILQNQESAELQLFAWTMNFPIGVGMLIAAIVGALVMALVGGVRIMQLRRQVTRQQ